MIYWLGVLHISSTYIQKVATLEKKKWVGTTGGKCVNWQSELESHKLCYYIPAPPSLKYNL